MTAPLRMGMIVPSLNTIAEDDLRLYCPADVRYHVHRVRLRKEGGRVTLESLARAYLEALDDASYLKDLSPGALVFNCTGASVAWGPQGDTKLAERMTRELGVPSTNTMVAIKQALAALGARRILHVCPFADEFSTEERRSLEAAGLTVVKSVGLNFTDARQAALMDPVELAQMARTHAEGLDVDTVLLSCANVRAFEAVQPLEQALGLPVVTSNQAVLWAVLKLLGWTGTVAGGGRLFALA